MLHNFLITTDKEYAAKGYGDYFGADGSIIEGAWRAEEPSAFKELPARTGMNYSREAKEVRDKYWEYFYSDAGGVPWQKTILNHDGYTPIRRINNFE